MATDEFSEYPDTGAEGAGEHSHPQDESIWFTQKERRDITSVGFEVDDEEA